MFLSRKEGVLGDQSIYDGSNPSAKKRRSRLHMVPVHPNETEFFGTSSYGGNPDDGLARKREVARLFSRMRNELLEIAHEFADDSVENQSGINTVRRGILVEMSVASEFVSDELDSVIAALCQAGVAAQSRAAAPQLLEKISRQAVSFAKLRNRISELQRELETMVEVTLRALHVYEIDESFNFDPIAMGRHSGEPFVNQFLSAVEDTINVLSELAARALQQRDFETVAEVCTCNVQLTNFLSDANRILLDA